MSVQIDFKCVMGHLTKAPDSAPTITAFLPEDAAEEYAESQALYAVRGDECDVTVFDPDPDGDMCSWGNAGGIAVTEVVPAAVPGALWRVPRWLPFWQIRPRRSSNSENAARRGLSLAC